MTKLELKQKDYIAYLKSKIWCKRKQMKIFEAEIAAIENEPVDGLCECIGELEVKYIDDKIICQGCGKRVR